MISFVSSSFNVFATIDLSAFGFHNFMYSIEILK